MARKPDKNQAPINTNPFKKKRKKIRIINPLHKLPLKSYIILLPLFAIISVIVINYLPISLGFKGMGAGIVLLVSIVLALDIHKIAISSVQPFYKNINDIIEGTGDLNQRIELGAASFEFKQLEKAFNQFLDLVYPIISEVKLFSGLVSFLIVELLETSQKVNDAARDQEDSLNSAVEKNTILTGNIEQSNTEIHNQGELVKEASPVLKELILFIKKTQTQAQAIYKDATTSLNLSQEGRDLFSQTQKRMVAVEENSREINQILEMVEDITDQTNMLSLNAAIEAARAGESGRGFAVVADEIGKLANQSGINTQQIGKLISKNNQEIEAVSDAVERSVTTFHQIAELIQKTTQAALENLEDANRQEKPTDQGSNLLTQVEQSTDSIVNVMRKQVLIGEEISYYITDANEKTTFTAKASKELLAQIEELSRQAKVLQEITQKFKLLL